jgi:hypothetical protein
MIGVLIVCGLAGFVMYSKLLGSTEKAIEALTSNPVRGIAGVIVMGLIFAAALWLIGLAFGG